MSRQLGMYKYSGNYEIKASAPIDARITAKKKSDLTDNNYWKSDDGNTYLYKGMLVYVYDDTNDNNGLYVFIGEPNNINSITDENDWLNINDSVNRTENIIFETENNNSIYTYTLYANAAMKIIALYSATIGNIITNIDIDSNGNITNYDINSGDKINMFDKIIITTNVSGLFGLKIEYV